MQLICALVNKSNLYKILLAAIITSISIYSHPFFFSSQQTWWQHEQGDPWPGMRWYHVAACLGYEGQHQRLLISGGAGVVTYDDMWLMDLGSGRMEKVRIALEDLSYLRSLWLRISCHCCSVIVY